MKCLNYFSYEIDNKIKRKFAYQFWKSKGKDVNKLNAVPDAWFSGVGALSWMLIHDFPINDRDTSRLMSAYNQLVEMSKKYKEPSDEKEIAPTKSIQDHINEAASQHIGEIEGALDELYKNGSTFDTKKYLSSHQVKSPVAKKIGEWFKRKVTEYKEAIDDKEVTDAYGGKRTLNKLLTQAESIVNDCNTIAVIAKTTRAPRKRKEKPASVLVAKMKWLREFIELGLKSVHPEKIVGSDMIMFYDTTKRKIVKYQSLDGYTLSVKGTTILNFDPEKSGTKIIRKPDTQLKGVANMSKRPISNLFNEIKATTGRVNGRTNEGMLLIGAY
jgi:hypothetical protein